MKCFSVSFVELGKGVEHEKWRLFVKGWKEIVTFIPWRGEEIQESLSIRKTLQTCMCKHESKGL